MYLSGDIPFLAHVSASNEGRYTIVWESMSKRVPVTSGEVYGRLTVLREVEPKISAGHKQRCVECRCECGQVREYRLYSLRNGRTQSCGCYAREIASRSSVTHGLSSSREYKIWQGMLHRCNNSSADSYGHYGGRGIKVCERWQSFELFYEDMGPRPSSSHSIDRIDVNGDYEPGNCRWATPKEQARNTRVNYLVEHDGEVKCIADWAEQYGLEASVLYGRLVQRGWTFEKSVNYPVYNRKKASSKANDPFYRVPRTKRDSAWQREHERREKLRIAADRKELASCSVRLAKSHRVNAEEFASRADAALLEGFTWNGAIFRALREMGAVK